MGHVGVLNSVSGGYFPQLILPLCLWVSRRCPSARLKQRRVCKLTEDYKNCWKHNLIKTCSSQKPKLTTSNRNSFCNSSLRSLHQVEKALRDFFWWVAWCHTRTLQMTRFCVAYLTSAMWFLENILPFNLISLKERSSRLGQYTFYRGKARRSANSLNTFFAQLINRFALSPKHRKSAW